MATVIILVLKDESGDLRFFIHPELREIVQNSDLHYLDDLLWDFVERARIDSGGLFKQLCSVGVGPLVTVAVGSDLSEFPDIQEQTSKFVQL
jgi:hypothetical protein